MSGWVKFWHAVSKSSREGEWRDAFATIDANQLSFHDNESLALNNGDPFLSIDLDTVFFHIS